jgi:hypothetical protein
MRLCSEFGIRHLANLITDFPGSTAAEVAATVRTIDSSAFGYAPLTPVQFGLGVGSTVDLLRTEFGVENVRNCDLFRAGLPHEVWRRLELIELDFDVTAPRVDWNPVREACARWADAHSQASPPRIIYRDGGTFLHIEDTRSGRRQAGTVEGSAREIYLYCMELRTREQLHRRFAGQLDDSSVDDMLRAFGEERLMHVEGGRYLSLAVAHSPSAAAARIRDDHRDSDSRALTQPRPGAVRLSVVS